MIILNCLHCKKQHLINESRIPPNIKLVRCKFCGKHFPLHIDKNEETTLDILQDRTHVSRKIGVTLSKGGVGKTTTAVNLATGLSMAGFNVLLIDTDTQGQASYILGVKPKAGLTELLTEKLLPEQAIIQARERLSLLAGGKSLAGVKRLIGRKDFGGELTLTETLASLTSNYDYIIVDTSPGWDPLTVNVLFYVNEILAPVSLEVMTLQGLVEFTKSIATIQKYRSDIELTYILPTFFDKRVKKSATILKKLNEIYEDKVCLPIRYNVKLSETPAYGQTIFEFAPDSPGAEDYRDLVRKVAKNKQLLKKQGADETPKSVNA